MKKNISFVVIFLMILSLGLAGCSGGSDEGDTSDDVSVDPVRMFDGVTINMIAEQENPTIALEKQLNKFTELTGITVNLEMVPFDSVVQKVTLAMQSRNGQYDVVAIPYQFLGNMVVNEYIMPLKPLMDDSELKVIEEYDENDIIQGKWEASGIWKDVIYGVPANSCIMFYSYRQDLFDNQEEKDAFKAKYGYDLEVPKDWDSYKDIAEFFTRKKGEQLAGETLNNDFYGVTIAGKRHDATTCEWLNYAWSFGGGIFDEAGNVAINSEENIAALEYYNDLKEYAPPGVTNATWDEQTTHLAQGMVAMGVVWNDGAPSLENPDESIIVGKVGYGAIPVDKAPAAHYGAWSYFIPTESKNPEAAWLFLQWFNTPEVQKNIALDGGFPNLYSTYNDPDLNVLPYWEASKDAYEISSTRPRIPEWNEMNEALMLEISNVMGDLSSPKKALDDCQEKYLEILEGQLPVTYQ